MGGTSWSFAGGPVCSSVTSLGILVLSKGGGLLQLSASHVTAKPYFCFLLGKAVPLFLKLFYFLIIVDIQYYISFRCTTEWLDIYITYKVISLLRLVPIWHHTQLLQYCWLYFLCCTLHPHDCFYFWPFYIVFLSPFSPILPTSPSIWQTSIYSLYVWVCFCFVCSFILIF